MRVCLFKYTISKFSWNHYIFLPGVTQGKREQASWAFMEYGLLEIIETAFTAFSHEIYLCELNNLKRLYFYQQIFAKVSIWDVLKLCGEEPRLAWYHKVIFRCLVSDSTKIDTNTETALLSWQPPKLSFLASLQLLKLLLHCS